MEEKKKKKKNSICRLGDLSPIFCYLCLLVVFVFLSFYFFKKIPLLSASLAPTHFLLFTFLSPTVTGSTLVRLFYTLKERY